MTEHREPFYLTSADERISFYDKYNILVQIGEAGQYGTAYRCKRKSDGLFFAVKIIDKTKIYKMAPSPLKESCIKSLKDEVHILQKLNHNYIIQLHDLYETANDVFIVMDECKGGELFDRIIQKQGFKEKEAKKIFKMIAQALFYLHSEHNVIHCDLKPDNILFVNNSDTSDIKLIDFGMAKIVPSFESCNQLCGTPYYTAPEVIDCQYRHPADMWSLGALLFTMIFGYPAFYVNIEQYQGMEETYQIYKLIKQGFDPSIKSGFGAWFPKDIIEMEGISDECMDLMAKLMMTDVTKRLTAKQVLQHKWFTDSETNVANISNVTHVSNANTTSATELFETDKNDKMSSVQSEKTILKCDTLELNKNEIFTIFNDIDAELNGYIYFEQALNALLSDHLISQNQRSKLFNTLPILQNEDIEKILKYMNDHFNIQNDTKINYDTGLAAISPTRIHPKYSITLLINGYMNGLNKIKCVKNISKDICGVVVSFYDTHICFTANI